MNKKIIDIALKKFKKLQNLYQGFVNVGIDNWRGYRFIFEVEQCTKCRNGCLNCPLYLLLKNEKEGLFSASLYPASSKDKRLFGPQKYLNCKTLKQYQKCYSNFLISETKTKKEIEDELKLLKDFKIIFSKQTRDLKKLEYNFKKSVIDDVLSKVNEAKKRLIIKSAKHLLEYPLKHEE